MTTTKRGAKGKIPKALIFDIRTENQRQEFVRDGCPASWLEYGEELRDAAEILWVQEKNGLKIDATLNARHELLNDRTVSSISKSYMLLAGFALENVIKGLLIACEPTYITSGSLGNELKTHDITELATRIAGIELSKNERSLCKSVSAAIPYWGRYPIPLRKTRLMPSIAVTKGLRMTFLRLFDRLASCLYWEIRDGWDSGIGVETIKMRSTRYGDSINPEEPLFR
jgi:hypothetical protein